VAFVEVPHPGALDSAHVHEHLGVPTAGRRMRRKPLVASSDFTVPVSVAISLAVAQRGRRPLASVTA
jgi:hypothetical protein